jgi:hypothetical protein
MEISNQGEIAEEKMEEKSGTVGYDANVWNV